MNDILKKIELLGVIPVVKIDDEKDALPLADALIQGGLPAAEITFRTNAAEGSIRAISMTYPNMLVGAGTVLNTEQADRAMAAGAKFIVTPGFNERVVRHCIQKGYPVVPGCPTPSDIELAIELGLDVVKFFPAENLGGVKMIQALAAPYVGVRFMPTGGINAGNITSYLSCDKILACGGSWMVKGDLISSGRFDEIERLTREAVLTVLGFRFDHVAINCENADKAKFIADLFIKAFGFCPNEIPVSYFVSPEIEVMKNSLRGKNGHIAILTNSIERAVCYLEGKGFSFDHDSCKYDKKGVLTFIYMNEDFGGFSVHLCK